MLKAEPNDVRDTLYWRRSLWLFILGMFLQVLAPVRGFTVDAPGREEDKPRFSRSNFVRADFADHALTSLVLGAAAVIHLLTGRSPRWKWSATALLITTIAESASVVIGGLALPAEFGLDDPQALAVRLGFGHADLLVVLEYWWLAVIVAEMAIFLRREDLIQRAETLGYAIMAGMLISVARAAWTIPDPLPQEDETTELIVGLAALAQFVMVVWTTHVLASAATSLFSEQTQSPSTSNPKADPPRGRGL